MDEEAGSGCAAKNEGYDDARFALVVYVGTPIAVAGVICNATLLRLFSSSRALRSPSFYLLVLAILDLLIDLIYLPFFTIDALAIYGQEELLFRIYHSYVLFLFGLSRMVQFASTYIVLCATIERFIVVAEIESLSFLITVRGRYWTVGVVLLVVFILRVPAFFEYHIVYLPACPVFEDYEFVPLLAQSDVYQFFNFYVMAVLQIFLPFLLLILLNVSIVTVTKRRLKGGIGWAAATFIDMPQITELIRKESINSNKRRRDELRNATWTMVCIVTSYLCCSCFSVFISVMEHIFPDNSLLVDEDGRSTRFYTYTADLVSILVALNSLLRIFIYMICSPTLRGDLLRCLHFLSSSKSKSSTSAFSVISLPPTQSLTNGKLADEV